jgi:hypothetical protein
MELALLTIDLYGDGLLKLNKRQRLEVILLAGGLADYLWDWDLFGLIPAILIDLIYGGGDEFRNWLIIEIERFY